MSSTFSPNLAIELIGTFDQAGSWGNTTNTNLGTLIEQAISGYVTQAVATGTDTTITIPNGATGVARNMYIELTGTGGASTNLIVPANKKLYFIFNNTSSGQVTVKVSGQTGISVPNGKKMILVSNGTDIVTAENYVASLSSDNLTLTGSLSVGTTSAFTGVATFTANPVLNGGTANGVLYLNGSKVATSGSALTFDGTDLATTGGVRLNNGQYYYGKNAAGSAVRLLGINAGNVNYVGAIDSGPTELNYGAASTVTTHAWNISGTGAMALTSTGLGIGTASPSFKLQVVGNQRIQKDTAGYEAAMLSFSTLTETGAIYRMGMATGGAFAIGRSDTSTTNLTLDSSGNLGLGVTPSAWSGRTAIQLPDNAYVVSSGPTVLLGANVYFNGVNRTYISNGVATDYRQINGEHRWEYAASGTAGGTISFTQAMTLDTSGALLVGNTTNYGVGSAENNTLQVKSGIVLAANNTGSVNNRNWIFQTNAAAAGSFSLAYSSTNTGWPNAAYALTITSSGNATVNGSVTAGKQDYSFQAIQRALTLNGDGVSGLYPLNSWRFYTTPGTIQTNQLLSIRAQDDTNGETGNLLSLTSTGNLGLGVTPSAWSTNLSIRAMQFGGGSVYSYNNDRILIGQNIAVTGTGTDTYVNTAAASTYRQYQGQHNWYSATSGGAGTNVSFGDPKMTLDASGNLGVGITSPNARLDVVGGTGIRVNEDGSSTKVIQVRSNFAGVGPAINVSSNDPLLFQTNNTERGRFTAGGYFKASNDGTYQGSTSSYHELRTSDNQRAVSVTNKNATLTDAVTGINVEYTAASPITTSAQFLRCTDSTALRAAIYSNGGIANYQTNDVNLSDERTKKDIAPLGSMWAKIKALEIVTFKYKDQTHDDDNIGLIAQQVESVAPEFVDADGWGETPEDGVPLKSVYTADMYHAAIKALQEAMARIESLEAKVSALEAK